VINLVESLLAVLTPIAHIGVCKVKESSVICSLLYHMLGLLAIIIIIPKKINIRMIQITITVKGFSL